ncbi:CRISPR system precrRNA processing endoribonuclease RAMP protein Cas6, partial [bacterium]|nr:CRISPR system precrRNA processing endoribonuclease RAMP protein Cas6 [bacterium]
MIDLPLARYRLEFEVRTPLHLPDYAGSTLRGAFGGALRAAACMTKRKACAGCPLLRTCPYAAIFETPLPENHSLLKTERAPAPYVIEPPPWGSRDYAPGEKLAFHLVLIGRALEHLPLVLWAFHRALERGVGPGDGTARLARVLHEGEGETLVLEGPEDAVREHPRAVPPALTFAGSEAVLDFHTPLRLQQNGRPLGPQALASRTLLTALMRRVSLICECHGRGRLDLDFKALARQAEAIADEKQLTWRDWTRYSSRQGQKMALGGAVGRWRLHGEIGPFLPFLHLGQWLHVGKETTFGLGRYTLKTGESAHISA